MPESPMCKKVLCFMRCPITTARDETPITKKLDKASYDEGYNTCMMELLQFVGPAGETDVLVEHLERTHQQKSRKSAFENMVAAGQ